MNTRTQHDLRYQPLYTLADVSRYARVPLLTLRNWAAPGMALIVPPVRNIVAPYSFINLVEAHVLVALRRTHHVPMQRIRRAVRWLSDHKNSAHPLAEVDLATDGYSLIVDHLGQMVSASAGGQIALPGIMDRYLRRIERDSRLTPVRFFPFTYDNCPKTIVMDPQVEYGRPVVTGTRIETAMIFDRFTGGESMQMIADDYDLDLPAVEEALRCENERRAA